MQFDKISSIVYHALNTDLRYRDYADLASAIQIKPHLIVKETSGVWYNYEFTNQAIELTIFNSDGIIINQLNEGNWIMLSMEVPTDYYVQAVDFFAKIMDPDGNISNSKKYGRGFGGLLADIKALRDMSCFECMKHFDLFKENEGLEKQIKKLSEEIQVLQTNPYQS